MDPRQRPLLTPQATWADKADEKVSSHRAAADRAAEHDRADGIEDDVSGRGAIGRLATRLRRLIRR
jgi:hypothetical protein